MTRRSIPTALSSLAALLCVAVAGAQNVITYEVDPQPSTKTYQITVDVPNVHSPAVRLEIPVWSPGAYMTGMREDNISDVSAEDSHRNKLLTVHPDIRTWEVEANGAQSIVFHYTVKNADLEEADGAPKRAHISGPSTYMYVVGRKQEPAALVLRTPAGARVWNVATSLDPIGGSDNGSQGLPSSREFTATSYDVLADAPVEMGDYAEDRFTAGGKPHSIVLYGDYAKLDRAKLRDYCSRVAATETAFYGDAPYSHYIFMMHASGGSGGGAGGLEHLGSTEIGLRGVVDDRVRSVIAHEYFHLWNVKRIRPFVLGPFDYQNPPHTANLWWCEGVTSYYGDLLSRRGGLNTDAEYLKHLAETITDLQNDPARLQVSADESSRRVWEANNSQGYGGLSYYTKGELVGLCLDLKIRQVTNNKRSLDDVIKALYIQCGRGLGPGYGEDDIKSTVNRISGHDLSSFYDMVARDTTELPLTECLSYAGVSAMPSTTPEPVADLGMGLRPGGGFRTVRVGSIAAGAAAEKAGLHVGDEIVAVDGDSNLMRMFAMRSAKPGAKYTITVMRDGQKKDIDFVVGSVMRTPWLVSMERNPTPEQLKMRGSWLGEHS